MTNTHLSRANASSSGYTARDVGKAYNFPFQYTGKGQVCGIIELGGGFGQADLQEYFSSRGLPVPAVKSINVDGGQNKSDGPNGADGEVLLDIEVAAAVAPDAQFNVYFCPNTDSGFLAGIQKAIEDGCRAISISWGGPENEWDPQVMDQYDAVFQQAQEAGIDVFVAAGDSGSGDGERGRHVDFPASSPHVVGCGGTRLTLNPDGSRASETVWNDGTSSSTGGGSSVQFPGRDVPDVAGNADPVTGYAVLVDGEQAVFGGTSAVAPLYAGLTLLLAEAVGGAVNFQRTVLAHPEVCFDVTSGNNGAFRAGPGRDKATGFGVVDGSKMLAVLQPAPDPTPPTPPTPDPTSAQEAADEFKQAVAKFLQALGLS